MKMKEPKINRRHRVIRFSLTKICLITALFLLVVQIIISNSLATSGGELQILNEKIQGLELENKKISTEIAQKVSLADILVKAEEKGFTREPKVVTLSSDMTVALKP